MEDKAGLYVARAVKARREVLGFTLRSLASASGISPSMISDIERGTKSPTIATLAMLAKALEVPIAALVDSEPAPQRIHVIRRSERQPAVDPVSGATRERFGPTPAGGVAEFLRYTVPPRAAAGPFAAHARGTIEHIHVAGGAVRLVCGDEAVRLEAGDSCSCFADAPHLFDNADGDLEASMYLVIEPGSATKRRTPRSARSSPAHRKRRALS